MKKGVVNILLVRSLLLGEEMLEPRVKKGKGSKPIERTKSGQWRKKRKDVENGKRKNRFGTEFYRGGGFIFLCVHIERVHVDLVCANG